MPTGVEETVVVGGAYVAGAVLFAGAAWLMTPAGQRASETLGEAMAEAADNAVQNITDIFSSDDEETQTTPTTTTTTNTTTRGCDGPHRGRLQVQGYAPRVEPLPIELSWPWVRDCVPPLRPEGLAALSGLFAQTQGINFKSAGYRGPAFSKMSQYIKKSPLIGFGAHSKGWAIEPNTKKAVPNLRVKGDPIYGPPRVDLEIKVGRAFGDR